MMTRRHFVRTLLKGFQALLLYQWLRTPELKAKAHGVQATAPEKAYVPLNGKSLRDLAASKAHHGTERFQNPFSAVSRGRLGRVLHWKLFAPNHHKAFYADERITPVNIDWQSIRAARGLSITYLKHAALLIKDVDAYILIDPVFNAPFWFIKDFSPVVQPWGDMPHPDHVLITHGHYDHLSVDALGALSPSTHVISPLGYNRIFKQLGMRQREQLDWFDTYAHNGREITLLPCNHWTMRNPFIGPNTALWGSYLIRTKAGLTLYISGDTGYFDGFRQLGEMYAIDLAIFNLGAYAPRWFMAPSHMNPVETVRAFKEIGAKHMTIAHWGTFRLGDEPVHFPPREMHPALQAKGLLNHYVALAHGQTLTFRSGYPSIREDRFALQPA